MLFFQPSGSEWQTITQLVQTIVVVIGIPLVIFQIHQQTQAIRLQSQSLFLSNYCDVMTEGTKISQMMFDDPDLAGLYNDLSLSTDLSDHWAGLDTKGRKFYLYLGRHLSLSEREYVLWKQGWVIDDADYQAMLARTQEIIQLRMFHLWWPRMKPYYRADFARYIESLAAQGPASQDSPAVHKPVPEAASAD